MDLVIEELNRAPIDYYNSLIDEGMLWTIMNTIAISEDGESAREINGLYAKFFAGEWQSGGSSTEK